MQLFPYKCSFLTRTCRNVFEQKCRVVVIHLSINNTTMHIYQPARPVFFSWMNLYTDKINIYIFVTLTKQMFLGCLPFCGQPALTQIIRAAIVNDVHFLLVSGLIVLVQHWIPDHVHHFGSHRFRRRRLVVARQTVLWRHNVTLKCDVIKNRKDD